jgi:hypothetical protein
MHKFRTLPGGDAQSWMNLQTLFDLTTAERDRGATIEQDVRPRLRPDSNASTASLPPVPRQRRPRPVQPPLFDAGGGMRGVAGVMTKALRAGVVTAAW